LAAAPADPDPDDGEDDGEDDEVEGEVEDDDEASDPVPADSVVLVAGVSVVVLAPPEVPFLRESVR
jgi:hypothetical protein